MAFAPILAANVMLASILHTISPVLALAAIATLAFAMHAWLGRLTRYIAAARAGLPLEHLHRQITRRPGHHPVHTPAAEVEPPAWVAIPAAGHKGRAALDHRLCTARHQPDNTPPQPSHTAPPQPGSTGPTRASQTAPSPGGGAPVTLGFSDGTARAWPPATRVSAQPFAEVEPPARSAETAARRAEAAAALRSLVRDLSRNGSTPLESVIKNHAEEHSEPAVQHAVQAAVLWGLIATTDGRDTQRLYALLAQPDPAEAAGIALTITQAGRLWLTCDPHRSTTPHPRPPRTQPKTSSTRPATNPARTTAKPQRPEDDSTPTQDKPTRAEGDSTPSESKPVHDEGGPPPVDDPRDGAVLTALAEVLCIPEVWERPGLGPARDLIAGAVAGGHPDTPAVRSATDQVLTLAGGLVLGVAGTGAYDVLRVFAA